MIYKALHIEQHEPH